VDGRYYPWGDHFDPSFCLISTSHRGGLLPTVVDSFPVDESVYGARAALRSNNDSEDREVALTFRLVRSVPPK